HKASAASARYAEAYGGNFSTGGAGLDVPLPKMAAWESRLSGDFDRQGFKDDHTAYARGHTVLRASNTRDTRRIWLNADLNILQQDPASPHPREGASLSSSVPLDANHNPAGAYVNENRIALIGGFERPIRDEATWGTTASYTFSRQRMFRGFLTYISNTPYNAAGF